MKYLPVNGPEEQRSVAAALQVLLASGNNILKFYELSSLLGKKIGDACEADSGLGYHSEAEGYKFFPEN